MIVGMIRLYRLAVSPIFPPACRYTPSCSNYAVEAFQTRTVLSAAWLSIRRVLRCHPWSAGGHDPLP
ncbi:MAG: membrane protein insertion efficiency factor YidD [Fidelibacterota bacterium]